MTVPSSPASARRDALRAGASLAVSALLVLSAYEHDRGDYAAARAAAERALRLAGRLPIDGAEARSLRCRAAIAAGHARRVQGDYAAAERVLRQALATADGDPLAVDALNGLAVLYKYMGRFDDAEPLLRRALEVAERAELPDVKATLLHNLGGLAHARGDYHAAEAPARQAAEIRQATCGPDHPAVAADRAALAAIVDALGRTDEAQALLRDALAAFERAHGPDHYEIAVTCNNLGAIAHRRGDLDEARRLYRQALTIKRRLLGDRHPDVAVSLNNAAAVELDAGSPDRAERLLNDAIAILHAAVEPGHPTLAAARANLAGVQARQPLEHRANGR
jgi:tetratricopeptide (TPR) repeat protein